MVATLPTSVQSIRTSQHGNPSVTVIMGGQAGSEGKGEFIAWYASQYPPSAVVRVGGPNAGHTMTLNGKTYKMRHIPCAWHTPARLYMGPGALIDIHVLESEFAMVSHEYQYPTPLLHIDRSAVVINDTHRSTEQSRDMWTKIGSTLEGVGAARADRVMRTPGILWRDVLLPPPHTEMCNAAAELGLARSVIVESTQGYELSLNYSGYYPQTTSADITPAQAMNDAGLGGTRNYQVIGVMRTYPIRVAGNSGPMYHEISWEELSKRTGGIVTPERTTVTNRIRRVGEWNPKSAREFGDVCKPDAICLTMVDYVVPDAANWASDPNVRRKIATWIDKVEQDVGAHVKWIGIGPGVIVSIDEMDRQGRLD